MPDFLKYRVPAHYSPYVLPPLIRRVLCKQLGIRTVGDRTFSGAVISTVSIQVKVPFALIDKKFIKFFNMAVDGGPLPGEKPEAHRGVDRTCC